MPLQQQAYNSLLLLGGTSYSLVHTLLPGGGVSFSHNAQCLRQTGRQTDGQTTLSCL